MDVTEEKSAVRHATVLLPPGAAFTEMGLLPVLTPDNSLAIAKEAARFTAAERSK